MEMNRIFKYYKNRKGITLVLMAFMLAVLLMLAGLAIDIAYMYYVKNQLQVAADASSLAGAAKLASTIDDKTSAFRQLDARQEAWKFACKNSAAGQNVYLVNGEITDKKGKVIGLRSCVDADIPADLNNNNNSENGDIVVGHWRSTNDVACQTTWESAGSGFFCRANGNTGLTINALKARPRRTSETPGMPQVRVFIGQIFRIINADWSFMSARASAIASAGNIPVGPFPICLPTCGLQTPLKTQWDYDKNQDSPIYCTDINLANVDDKDFSASTPQGQLFQFGPSTEAQGVRQPGMAWTNFQTNDCALHPACNMPNPGEILPYILGTQSVSVSDICNKNICTTNGAMGGVRGNSGDKPGDPTLRGQFLANKKTYPLKVTYPSGNTETINVDGWLEYVPIVSDDTCGGSSPCPGAQAESANPYKVVGYTRVLMTDVVTTGGGGVRFVGMENPRQVTLTFNCTAHGHTTSHTIKRVVTNFDSLTCSDCTQQSTPEDITKPRLVK